MSRRKRSLPKYAPAVIRAAEQAGKLKPGLYVVDVQHDDWCDLLEGVGPCNCDPTVKPPQRYVPPEEN
jgi:hypothetical protein